MEMTWACTRDIVHVGVDLWLSTATGGRAAPQELVAGMGSQELLLCMLGATLPCRKWTSRKSLLEQVRHAQAGEGNKIIQLGAFARGEYKVYQLP